MENLKVLRKKLGKTQEQMAEIFGVSQPAYQRYEKGERDIPIIFLEKLGRDYKVNLHWLILGDGEPFIKRI